jgi:hypothetical protein
VLGHLVLKTFYQNKSRKVYNNTSSYELLKPTLIKKKEEKKKKVRHACKAHGENKHACKY